MPNQSLIHGLAVYLSDLLLSQGRLLRVVGAMGAMVAGSLVVLVGMAAMVY
jgi:hypothetical protein